MIKEIKIKNFQGIKKQIISFERKNLNGNNDTEDQIIKHKDKNIALCPTFLSKNASGKTSIIKAIDFILRFATKESFVQELAFYMNRLLWMEQMRERMDADQTKNNENTDTFIINPIFKQISKIMKTLFNDVSFVGSSEVAISLSLIDGRKISLWMNESDIILKGFCQGGKPLSIFNILKEISLKKEIHNNDRPFLKNILIKKINKILDDNNFCLNINHEAHLYDSARKSKLKEINTKYLVTRAISNINKIVGFNATKTLIKKMDDSIKGINFNVEQKSFEIWTKKSDLFPISAKNLSYGTQKALLLISDALELFQTGGILMVDEIENGLHLSLIKVIIRLFEDSNINKKKTQIILTTHNPLLFEQGIIQVDNFIIYNKGIFQPMRNLNWDRTETKKSALKQKNFFNDVKWQSMEMDGNSTLSKISINTIIRLFEQSFEKAQNGKKH